MIGANVAALDAGWLTSLRDCGFSYEPTASRGPLVLIFADGDHAVALAEIIDDGDAGEDDLVEISQNIGRWDRSNVLGAVAQLLAAHGQPADVISGALQAADAIGGGLGWWVIS